VSSAHALTEEGLLSAKVFLAPWVFLRWEPWMPNSRQIWRTGTAVTGVEAVPSAKPFAESGSQNALGEGALHHEPGLRRELDLVLSAKRVCAERWIFGSRRTFALTVKTMFPVVHPVSGMNRRSIAKSQRKCAEDSDTNCNKPVATADHRWRELEI
jgi:hypothetical protein